MVLQKQAPPPTSPPVAAVVRELKKNQVHKFKVSIVSGSSIDPMKTSYLFSAKTEIPVKTGEQDDLDFKIQNYSVQAEGLDHFAKLTGAGKLSISDSGLPGLLMENIRDPKFWFPLICLYLPTDPKDDAFDAGESLSSTVTLKGKGHIDGRKYDLAGSLFSGPTEIGKFDLQWTIDSHGWPNQADGKLEDSTGTISFTLSRS